MNAFFRRATEKILGRLVVRRRLPETAGGGCLYASARVGGLKYLFRRSVNLDAELIRIACLLVKSGDVVWDIGANVGLFSVAAAAQAGSGKGRVIAVEADIDAVVLLNKTASLQPKWHADITVLPIAANSVNGFISFSIAARARAANAILGFGSTQMGGVREVRVLPCMTLDFLLENIPVPQVLKIDVEGAEFEVFRGASRLLKEVRPVIYCEVSEKTRQAVTLLFAENRYKIWDGSSFDGSFRGELQLAAENTVAFPDEMVSHEASRGESGPTTASRGAA